MWKIIYSFAKFSSTTIRVGVFTAGKFNTDVFASDFFILAKLQSGVFTAGGITEWSSDLPVNKERNTNLIFFGATILS